MKTLILASSGQFITQNNIDQFLPKKIRDCSIAYITTASKKVNDDSYVKIHREQMDRLNFSYTEFDIAGKTEEVLRKALNGYDVVLVEGGNTFYLLKAVRESGFDRVVKDLVENGVVYIGSSAGSYIACPSIIMATWSTHNFDRCGIVDFTGMNMVSFLFKAHYAPSMESMVREKMQNLEYPLKILNDGQAILVQDENIQFIGDGEEIILL